jgi:tetratricopeptide (TPR) repeat protein
VAQRNRRIAIAVVLSSLYVWAAYGQTTTSYSELDSIGRSQYRAGQFASAENALQRAFAAAEAAGDRQAVVLIKSDLGDVYVGEERLGEAEQAYSRALAVLRGMAGKQLDTAAVLRNLASVYALQGRYDEALKVLDQSAKLLIDRGSELESESLKAEILNSKGIVFLREEKFDQALKLFEEALHLRSAGGFGGGLGDAQTLNNIGVVYLKQRRYRQAEEPLRKSLDLSERIMGPSHPDITLTLGLLGKVYMHLGRYSAALDQYEKCLDILRNVRPTLDARLAHTLQLIGDVYLKGGDNGSAETALAEAVEHIRHIKAGDDPSAPEIFESYADVLMKTGKADQSRQLLAEARRIRATAALTVRVPASR